MYNFIRKVVSRLKEQIEAVQRMQEYIEANLYDSITLADLSKVSFFRRGTPIGCL